MLEAFGLDRNPDLGLPDGGSHTILEDEDPRLAAAGQGSLTVNPLQVARAFAALVSRGFLPVPRLIEAQRLPGEAWVSVAAEGSPTAATSAVAASEVIEALPILSGGSRGVVARAAVGEAGQYLAWFAGFRGDLVVVVVLEDGTPQEALRAGVAVLDAQAAVP
jgi:cell division protein FtsI/penicillin-binding protein 2